MKGWDDSTSVRPDRLSRRQVNPAENVVFGIAARTTFLKKFFWEGNGGLSFYTRNIGSSVRFDSTSLFPSALTVVLLKGRVRLSSSLGLQRDNLQNQKQATSRRVIGSTNLSADFTEQLGIDLNFTNFSSSQRASTLLVADSFLIAQTTRNLSITPRYLITNTRMNHSFLLSYNRMTLTNQNDRTAGDNNIRSNNLFFNYQVTFVETGRSLSLNLNSATVDLASGKNANEGITAGLTKRMLDNKITLGINNSFLRGTWGNGHSSILNNGLRADLLASKMHRFNVGLNFIGNYSEASNTEKSNPRYSEFRGELGYNFSF
ncbi:MAG TPA: hypothetical protein VK404_12055 [Spirosoma sp.]|nr:hypothetical protein [Spirosoma sp.]